MKTGELIDAFLGWCADQHKPATVAHYRKRLKKFREAFSDREIQALTKIETEAVIVAAGKRSDGSPLAPDTRRANIVVAQVFQNWLLERDVISEPFLPKMKKPRGRLRSRLPTPFESAKLLKFASREFYLIYRTLLGTGARPNELCRANIEDWNREKGEIVLEDHKTREKTGRPRIIPVGARVQRLIERSIGKRKKGPIFRTKRRKRWTVSNLSQNYTRCRKKAGLPRELILYLARHEHLTKIANKFGIDAARQAGGHASSTTTERYVIPDTELQRKRQDEVE